MAESRQDETVEPEPLGVSATERIFWSRSTSFGIGVFAPIGAVLLLALAAVIAATLSSAAPGWLLWPIALIGLATLATAWWRVTIDRRGLRLRGLLGWPRARIPLDDIRSVAVVQVNPTADFGGWGWRWARGRSGLIMRSGEAIEVRRGDGRRFTVTVDDAETASAALAGLTARRKAPRA
jgi:hypothetical protein